jgi:DNA-binding MarR family transcriptional regulator
LGEDKSAQPPTDFSVALDGRDLEDARRILTGIVRAGERRSILNGGQAVETRHAEEEDAAERLALQMFAIREARDILLPDNVSSSAAWDVLLAAYVAERTGVRHNVGRMIEISRMKLTTGLRHIDLLEAEGLVERQQDRRDGRVFYVKLSPKGREIVDQILSAALPG